MAIMSLAGYNNEMNTANTLASLDAATGAASFLHCSQGLPILDVLYTLVRRSSPWAPEALLALDPPQDVINTVGITPLDMAIMCFNQEQSPVSRNTRKEIVFILAPLTTVSAAPLHLAAAVNFSAAIAPLVVAGHDLRAISADRKAPLEIAFSGLNAEVARALIKAGAARSWYAGTPSDLDKALIKRAGLSQLHRAAVERFELALALRDPEDEPVGALPSGRKRI
jgi:ankyrin repeat protein